MNGKKLAARPEGCAVTEFPSTTPDYPWEDLATVHASCSNVTGRDLCMKRLRDDACEAGGDTIYNYKDGFDKGSYIVIATIARRTGTNTVAKTSGLPAAVSGDCDPPCSPGYRCQSGQCIAVCNPACGEGMSCAPDRTCKPTAAAQGSP